MRATTCSPLALAISLSPNRVRPRTAPLTSPSRRRRALNSAAAIEPGNSTASTSSHALNTSHPAAAKVCATSTLFLLRATPDLPLPARDARGAADRRLPGGARHCKRSVGPVPKAFCASAHCMNASRSPSRTAAVFEVEVPVRRSFSRYSAATWRCDGLVTWLPSARASAARPARICITRRASTARRSIRTRFCAGAKVGMIQQQLLPTRSFQFPRLGAGQIARPAIVGLAGPYLGNARNTFALNGCARVRVQPKVRQKNVGTIAAHAGQHGPIVLDELVPRDLLDVIEQILIDRILL